MLNKRLILRQTLAKFFILILFVALLGGCYFFGKHNAIKEIGRAAFTADETVKVSEEWVNPYEGLIAKDRAYYICKWSTILGVPTDFVVSGLLVENPQDDPMALSKPNKNGSYDVGYFQLNSKYVYTTFKDRYWNFCDVEFDPMNWQHNTYVAIRLMKDLLESFNGNMEKAAAAYNCGASRTISGDIPQSTQVYVARVMNNYKLLSQS